MNEISLTTWLQAERNRLEEFAALWRRKSGSGDSEYPERMESIDWDEQYAAFSDRYPV